MDLGSALSALLVGSVGAATARMRWSFPGRCSVLVESVTLGLIVMGQVWTYMVMEAAPEPYLDEVFHIPQAQEYCNGHFGVWDPKITTPPGLYLLSYLTFGPCSVLALRALNTAATVAVFHLALRCRFELEAQRSTSRALSTYALHTAANIALFPVLFFFSGLYYTDIASATAVLLALAHQLRRLRLRREGEAVGWASDVGVVVLGVGALFMRQTNVFWVVVFNGGLEAVDAVKTIKAPRPEQKDDGHSVGGRVWQVLGQYAAGHVHDPLLNAAWLDDMVYTAISIAVAVACNPLTVLGRVWPHISLLALFGGFVAWNGGVVLGDKSNHVATIHAPQMLYIWPFFAFFLAPLLVPAVLRLVVHPLDTLGLVGVQLPVSSPISSKASPTSKKASHTSPTKAPPSLLAQISHISSTKPFRPLATIATTLLFTAFVHYNTIIHPFTLADNRHYTFYIFRHTIRRSTTVRLALVIPYALCMLLSWGALHNPPPPSSSALKLCQDRFVNHPFLPSPQPCPLAQEPDKVHPNRTSAMLATLDARESRATQPAPASTALLAIAASALSLITAPLVEPRYFIIPWITWRLLVPAWQPSVPSWVPSWARHLVHKHDVRLFVETAWFVVVNLGTMYVFVAWPYVWRAEDGAVLDGGKVQHFMW